MWTEESLGGRRLACLFSGRKRRHRFTARNLRRLHVEALEERTLLSLGGGGESTGLLPPVDASAAEADYLIIAAHDLYDPADPDNAVGRLAEWKQKKGFKTHVLRLFLYAVNETLAPPRIGGGGGRWVGLRLAV